MRSVSSIYNTIKDFGLQQSAIVFFFFQAEDGIRDDLVTGVQTCALPISGACACPEAAAACGVPAAGACAAAACGAPAAAVCAAPAGFCAWPSSFAPAPSAPFSSFGGSLRPAACAAVCRLCFAYALALPAPPAD